MEMTTKRSTPLLSMEKLLLLFVMIIGCYGLKTALGPLSGNGKYQKEKVFQTVLSSQKEILQLNGSFKTNAPIQFTVALTEEQGKKYQIHFGNGISKSIKNGTFTYAYKEAGTYHLEIKNEEQIVHHTTIEIRHHFDGADELAFIN